MFLMGQEVSILGGGSLFFSGSNQLYKLNRPNRQNRQIDGPEVRNNLNNLTTGTPLNRELFQNLRGSPDRLKDEDICYNNKIMKQMECDER